MECFTTACGAGSPLLLDVVNQEQDMSNWAGKDHIFFKKNVTSVAGLETGCFLSYTSCKGKQILTIFKNC